ncbi:hypothetical protein [Roseateles sp. P5_E4]
MLTCLLSLTTRGARAVSFAGLAAALLLSACAAVGTDFDPALVAKMTPNVSTLDDAAKLLGNPTSVTQHPDGSKSANWVYGSKSLFHTSSKTLALHFGQNGTLTY